MSSQTDKENLNRLKTLRNHKLKKTIIEIESVKLALKKALEKEAILKNELQNYHKKRKLKHQQLYGDLKKNKAITIDTLNRHQSKNQALINEEQEKMLEVKNIEKQLLERKSDVKKCQQTLSSLQKKIEGLNMIESSFFRR
jgi:hypothetical protein